MKWTTTAALLLAASFNPAVATVATQDLENASFNRCTLACLELAVLLKGRVALYQSSPYQLGDFQYWSAQQSSQRPACRVYPKSALDVSITVKTLKLNQCNFAVKSGGHASFAGASNIDGNGVAIDLRDLSQLTVSKDRKQANVGAGMLWSDLYMQLDAQNLSTIGGRSGAIGVGGLTLGGGISFFSGRYGFACDNVNNYQVIFADGSINNVNKKSHPDLFWALRGGGNNFGIVTRFDLASFEQGKMWGGQIAHTADNMPALNTALYNFNINHYKDPYGAVILAYVYIPAADMFLASVDLEYGKPIADAPILANFTSIPSIQTSARITNLTDLTVELNATQPSGLRETFWTFTVKNDVKIMTDIQALFASKIPDIANASSLLPALVFQPISTAITSHFSSNGGNALGITDKDGPLILINISIAWADIKDDARILKFAADFIGEGVALSKKRKLDHSYIYQNYAAKQQDVFTGYGPVNHAKLKKVQKKYDPQGVFEKLQPGYFKL
ncbi:hypothetical protein V495_04101 [Pseudogymnoascus sp. VKM F-4514 (FW-929)]|nr:hypothetical protein V495_04101 [Pseudogymnoascus sp. VKM F-4514 (FW-929)]KFY64423.1 hypothetical protein V497_01709 [Pseudogymnoascus sp. VKM F-4516 (FW-969)]